MGTTATKTTTNTTMATIFIRITYTIYITIMRTRTVGMHFLSTCALVFIVAIKYTCLVRGLLCFSSATDKVGGILQGMATMSTCKTDHVFTTWTF